MQCNTPCPLYPRKRTCAVHSPMSAGEDCANALAYLSVDQQKAIAPTSGSGARQIRNLKKGLKLADAAATWAHFIARGGNHEEEALKYRDARQCGVPCADDDRWRPDSRVGQR